MNINTQLLEQLQTCSKSIELEYLLNVSSLLEQRRILSVEMLSNPNSENFEKMKFYFEYLNNEIKRYLAIPL